MILKHFDVVIIGGGIHGAATAVDAAGRGLKALVLEKGDLGAQTTQYNTQLIHGGLRYLDQFNFGLVKEGLAEQKLLLQNASYLLQPLEFLLIQKKKWLRPEWLVRMGLSFYDLMRGHFLPRSQKTSFEHNRCLDHIHQKKSYNLWSFFDAQTESNRLVISDAQLAQDMGTKIATYASIKTINSTAQGWIIQYEQDGEQFNICSKILYNLTGPWVNQFFSEYHLNFHIPISLVQGSHIVLDHILDSDGKAIAFENDDGRLIFFIPKGQNTIIGTTDYAVESPVEHARPSPIEIDYLIEVAEKVLGPQAAHRSVIHAYAGIRCLPFDPKPGATTSRESEIVCFECPIHQWPIFTLIGGKMTSARKTAENLVSKAQKIYPQMGRPWTQTKRAAGAQERLSLKDILNWLEKNYSFLELDLRERLGKSYGMRCATLLKNIRTQDDLGPLIIKNLYAHEVKFLMQTQWVRSFEDLIDRRLGWKLNLTKEERKKAYSRFIKHCSAFEWETNTSSTEEFSI